MRTAGKSGFPAQGVRCRPPEPIDPEGSYREDVYCNAEESTSATDWKLVRYGPAACMRRKSGSACDRLSLSVDQWCQIMLVADRGMEMLLEVDISRIRLEEAGHGQP